MNRLLCCIIAWTIVCLGMCPLGAYGQSRTIAPSVIVIDASGSMADDDGQGHDKISSAIDATQGFLGAIGEQSAVGLVAYGLNVDPIPGSQEAGCRDISIMARPGEFSPHQLASRLADLKPKGWTPIGAALRQADEILPDSQERSIILVSDGIDTCSPPSPCDVAKELKDKGVDLMIHTIGFNVDEKTRQELSCIAKATGGIYGDADGAESLEYMLKRAAMRSATRASLPETVVVASPDSDNAPSIPVGTMEAPAAVTVTVPSSAKGKNHYVSVDLSEGVSALQMGVVMPRSDRDGALSNSDLLFKVKDLPYSMHCSTHVRDVGVTMRNVQGLYQSHGVICEADENGKIPAKHLVIAVNNPYRMQDAHYVVRTSALNPPVDFPASSMEMESAERDEDDISLRDIGEASSQVMPGSDLESAPEISGSIEAEIVPGEQHYYRIPIEWGQVLDARIESLTTAEELNKGFDGSSWVWNTLRVQIVNSVGQRVEAIGKDFIRPDQGEDGRADFGMSRAISYGNMANDSFAWKGSEIYLVVDQERNAANYSLDEVLFPVRYRLTPHISGEGVEGPRFSSQEMDISSTEKNERKDLSLIAKMIVLSLLGVILLGGGIAAIVFIGKHFHRKS